MHGQTETLEGFVVDIACIRHYPRYELVERAAKHTRQCTLEPHCIESGYGLVKEGNRLALLDEDATPRVVEVARRSKRERGIRLRVQRRHEDGRMKTVHVEEVETDGDATARAQAIPSSEIAASVARGDAAPATAEGQSPRAPDGKTAERYAG